MDNRISLVTLGTDDLERAINVYESGLNLPRQPFDSDSIAFFKLQSGQFLALFPIDDLAKDACMERRSETGVFRGITLAHNVSSREAVDTVLNEAREAGGKILKPAQEPPWGGWSGYFADPDGHVWEVAYPTLSF